MSLSERPAELDALREREWARLAAPGTWFTGEERVALAAVARGFAPRDPAQAAARAIHDAPAGITRAWLADLERQGLTLLAYVEVLGVVARLRAMDTLAFGLGLDAPPLPTPRGGTPDRTVTDAETAGCWVPTVGKAWPPTVLSSVPAENAAMHDVHEALYLAADQGPSGLRMGNQAAVRDGLTRPQMEFIASRTSLLNECFF